ncbi:hypothetical protein [Paenibacillus qinlingensis]|uniref:hypothetical protein n=1 Tax=Paenibacillus qinlingensis TaxID=1837343 RepID=UPI001566F2A7|nr:hypothetical protein [Paenibacillus qinlingensis]NQX62215.1 hypothetical protein [Paenibacillus qinlingensis]
MINLSIEKQIAKIKKRIDGATYIKSVTVGIPYAIINLDISVRKEITISFFHEIVLKFIGENWNNYDELLKVLGIDQDFLDNILLELGRSDYIVHSGKQLFLTSKGKNILIELKSVLIEPDFLNNIFVNLMDGSIHTDLLLKESNHTDVCLNNIWEVDLSFFINKEDKLRDIFLIQQRKEEESISSEFNQRTELYRIMDIQRNRIIFHEVDLDIYYAEDDKSLLFEFNMGSNNTHQDFLVKSIREQIDTHPKTVDRLFDTEYYKRNKWFNLNAGEIVDLPNLVELKKEFLQYEDTLISSKEGARDGRELVNHQNTLNNRLMLYKEYKDWMQLLPDLSNNECLIISDKFQQITDDDTIFTIINKISEKNKIILKYKVGDNNTKKFIDKIQRDSSKNKNIVTSISANQIMGTTIIVKKTVMIKVFYNPIIVMNEIIFEEIPYISFDEQEINAEFDRLL